MITFGGDPEAKVHHVALARRYSTQSAEHDYVDLGVPVDLVVLQRRLCALLPPDLAAAWPVCFLSAIPVGCDLSGAFARFAHWLLADLKYGVRRCLERRSPAGLAIKQVTDLYVTGGSHRQWVAAGDAAESAAASAVARCDAHGAWAAAWAAARHVVGDACVDELLDSACLVIGVSPERAARQPNGGRTWADGAIAELLDILASPVRHDLDDDAAHLGRDTERVDAGAPGGAG